MDARLEFVHGIQNDLPRSIRLVVGQFHFFEGDYQPLLIQLPRSKPFQKDDLDEMQGVPTSSIQKKTGFLANFRLLPD